MSKPKHPGIWRHFDDRCWPVPGEGLDTIEYALRFGDPESLKHAASIGASVLSAYTALVRMPEDQRNAIIRELRKGPGVANPPTASGSD